MELHIQSAEFVTTAMGPEGWPKSELPEFAFVGRSNVGKSSLINALCKRRKLVRVSNTPGRTRSLNFFRIEVGEAKKRVPMMLCDLPGYGFAKISKTERAPWQALIDGYLTGRESLRGVVQLIDGEIGPTELDEQTLKWLTDSGRPLVLVATKIDRLNKARRMPALRAHAMALRMPETQVLGVSSTEPLGISELLWRLVDLSKAKEE